MAARSHKADDVEDGMRVVSTAEEMEAAVQNNSIQTSMQHLQTSMKIAVSSNSGISKWSMKPSCHAPIFSVIKRFVSLAPKSVFRPSLRPWKSVEWTTQMRGNGKESEV